MSDMSVMSVARFALPVSPASSLPRALLFMRYIFAMKIFDVHAHIYPDKIAARVLEQLTAEALKGGLVGTDVPPPAYDGTRVGLLAKLASSGFTGAMNCPVATKSEQTNSINDWAALQNAWPILSMGSVHPDYPDIAGEVRRIKALGLHGIKMHPEFQQFRLDDPRVDPLWSTARELGLPVLLHTGLDFAFPPPCNAPPRAVRNLAERWPGLTVIAGHFGGWSMWDEVERELLGASVFLDLAFVPGFLQSEQLVRMIRRHGADRVLFGTDAPWLDPATVLAEFLKLPLVLGEQEKILWQNAAGLFLLPA